MMCSCNPPVACGKKVSQTAANPNREYFTCVNPHGNCNFFHWVDAPVSGAFKTQPARRTTAPSIPAGPSKAQVVLSVAEMVLDEVDGDSSSGTELARVWINIMVRFGSI